MDNEVNSYIVKRMLELLTKSLVLTGDSEAVKENWWGELLVKLHIKRRRYIYKAEIPSGKVLKIVRVPKLKLPRID